MCSLDLIFMAFSLRTGAMGLTAGLGSYILS